MNSNPNGNREELCGVMSIIKPAGFTSHDIVAIMRRILKFKKIGHTGTLDPDACGVLPICIGRATKISDYIMNDKKEYYCGVTLGVATTTLDTSGKVMERLRDDELTKNYIEGKLAELDDILKEFEGEITQTPPMYSAVKFKGQKLVDMARRGESIDLSLKKRKIKIYSIERKNADDMDPVTRKLSEESGRALSDDYNPHFFLKVVCSKGTYIRSLCADIAQRAGTIGAMSSLVRTVTGRNELEKSIHIETLGNMEYEAAKVLIEPMENSLSFKRIEVTQEIEQMIKYGVKVNLISRLEDADESGLKAGDKFTVFAGGRFLAISSVKVEENGFKKLTVDKLFFSSQLHSR